jgi:hypothetical protein
MLLPLDALTVRVWLAFGGRVSEGDNVFTRTPGSKETVA